jgi:hypothetical protein
MVVSEARYGNLTVQSNMARTMAAEVAAAASSGLITSVGSEGFGRRWFVTSLGIQWLEGADL